MFSVLRSNLFKLAKVVFERAWRKHFTNRVINNYVAAYIFTANLSPVSKEISIALTIQSFSCFSNCGGLIGWLLVFFIFLYRQLYSSVCLYFVANT